MMATAEIANQVFQRLRDERASTETATYVAVPGNDRARWLLPAASPGIGRVLASWTPYRAWSRVSWAAIRAASRTGRITQFPGVSVLEVEGTRDADWESLGWRGHEPPIPVIYLGTPGSRRKAVVHLVDRASGECKAVVKVPLTEEAKVAVLHEAEVLQTLANEQYGHSPRLVHVYSARGITTQTFVDGRSGSRKLAAELWLLLHSLLLPGETTTQPERAQRWTREISCSSDGAAENKSVIAAIDELQDDSPLPACWEHGDFTPWNIKRLSNGGCALLDWEDAQRKGLPLQDAFHFLHMQDWLFDQRPTLHAAEMSDGAVGMGVNPAQVATLEAAYLINSYLKCIREHNHERARFLNSTLALPRRKAA